MTASDRRRFMCIAGSGVLVLTGYVVLGMLRLGGDRPSVVVEDLLEAGVALFAAGACAYSSRLAEGGARLAWALLAGSALIWTAGQLVSTAMEATASVHLAAADASFLLAIPLAIAGVMSFLFASGDSRGQLRLLLDGGIVSVCVIYVAWAVGLSDAYLQARIDTVPTIVVLAYAAGDLVLLTVVGASLGRVSPESRAVMMMAPQLRYHSLKTGRGQTRLMISAVSQTAATVATTRIQRPPHASSVGDSPRHCL